MYLKPRKKSTDPRLRSLLQKAVRRQNLTVVTRTAALLHELGDKAWLRSRTVVITFEECWPLASSLNVVSDLSSKLKALQDAASAAKQKDAAGLGAMAHAFSEGDGTVLDYAPDRRAIMIVGAGLGRPREFFDWLLAEPSRGSTAALVRNAQKYLPAATWPWDKACILAGAFLGSTGSDQPHEQVTEVIADRDFAFWAALDKHTDEGKRVLKQVASELCVPYRQLTWTSFYFESARVNRLIYSPWFEAERSWRLARAGLTVEDAVGLWTRAKPIIRERLAADAETLRDAVMSEPMRVN